MKNLRQEAKTNSDALIFSNIFILLKNYDLFLYVIFLYFSYFNFLFILVDYYEFSNG